MNMDLLKLPYRKIDPETHRATDIVEYMSADVEDNYIIAQASEPMDENGEFINERIRVRYRKKLSKLKKIKFNIWMFHQNN